MLAIAVASLAGCGSGTGQAITLDQCESFPAEGDWSADGEMIRTAGEVKGYLATRQAYGGDGVITVQYQFQPSRDGDMPDAAANTGLLFHIAEEDRVWPVCIEAQGKWSEMGELKANGGLDDVGATLMGPRRDAVREKVGLWNELRIEIADGRVKSYVNGVPVAESGTGGRTSGRIGIQSERYPVLFREFRTTLTPSDP